MSNEQPQDVGNIRIDKDSDLIFCSVGLYKFFLAHGQPGMEALQVYQHLMFTARLQETEQVLATNTYIKHGLQTMGNKKLKEAKAFLAEHGLISYIFRKDESGKVVKVYTKVKVGAATAGSIIVTADPPEQETTGSITTRVDNDTCGQEQQMLKTSNEMLSNSGHTETAAAEGAPIAEPSSETLSEKINTEEEEKPASSSSHVSEGEVENGQNTEVLSQLRELYMQNYKVRLKISRREKALVAESIGYINEQDFLRGYYAYMLDGGEGAEREKHPLAWYLEQVSQWVAKAIDKDWMEDAEGRWNPKWVRQVRHYLGMPFNHICGECGVQGGRHLPSCVNAEKVAAI